MPRPKRNVMAVAEETCNPPLELAVTQSIAQIIKAEGNNLYSCKVSGVNSNVLVELPSRFRNTIWLKRGSYVLVDTQVTNTRQNKIYGEIVNIVRNERLWGKQSYWPKKFAKAPIYSREISDGQESTIGEMPPSDSEEE